MKNISDSNAKFSPFVIFIFDFKQYDEKREQNKVQNGKILSKRIFFIKKI